ncbi:MAG: hypothetical protein EXS48_00185 [Candidatus Staskawiczbacteria bacterium]|nr:hypothetical protein [Candidatus Staskawiczbacteria bacterium]
MSLDPENNYEDSSQREERLMQELHSAFEEVVAFFESAESGIGEMRGLSKKFSALEERIEESDKLEHDLKIELDKLKAKEETISDLDEKIDASRDVAEQQAKIWELWSKQDDLYKEFYKICEDEAGMKGDVEGTMAIIQMKIEKIEAIKKELRELGN